MPAQPSCVRALRCAAVVAAVWAVSLAQPALARELTVLTHNTSHQVLNAEGTLKGIEHAGKRAFYVELVRALLAELGHAVAISDVPFARGLRSVEEQDDVVFFNVTRTAEREARMQWVGPISVDLDVFYEDSAHPTGIKTIDDARLRRVCVLRDGVHDRQLSALGFSQLIRVSAYAQCFVLLRRGRVDLTPSAVDTLKEKLQSVGIAESDIRRAPVILSRTEGYVALSRNLPAGEVQRWNDALARLRASGKYQALQERYMAPR